MTVAEVEALNGEPFFVGGFWWDYGGYANIETGKLSDLPGGCYLSLRFSPSDGYPENIDVTAVPVRCKSRAANRCCSRSIPAFRSSASAMQALKALIDRRSDCQNPRHRVTVELCWFPKAAVLEGSKGNTVRRTHQGAKPWLPPQL